MKDLSLSLRWVSLLKICSANPCSLMRIFNSFTFSGITEKKIHICHLTLCLLLPHAFFGVVLPLCLLYSMLSAWEFPVCQNCNSQNFLYYWGIGHPPPQATSLHLKAKIFVMSLWVSDLLDVSNATCVCLWGHYGFKRYSWEVYVTSNSPFSYLSTS